MAEQKGHHSLRAIFLADAVGSTPQLERYGEEVGVALRGHLRELFEPKIKEFAGQLPVPDTRGDGRLAHFAKPVDAINCAIAVQGAMLIRNWEIPAERRVEFRIGIHVDEILIEETGISGLGVHIAERVQELAEPNGICISAAAHHFLRDDLNLNFFDMGERQVKNTRVRAFRIILPLEQKDLLFSYEKDIIRAYIAGNGHFSQDMILRGCPDTWPDARKLDTYRYISNPIPPEAGGTRKDAKIRVDARVLEDQDPSVSNRMVFPEAGPRNDVIFRNPLRVAILVSGGIAPGINAAVEGIVARHRQYRDEFQRRIPSYQVEIGGYQEGYKALIGASAHRELIRFDDWVWDARLGGSVLATARADELLVTSPTRNTKLEAAAWKLQSDGVNILYVIGGDGSMRAANAIAKEYKKRCGDQLITVGIPKTMDNDILWVWQSFGFLSAVERAREFIQQLHTEVTSNPRLAVVQLFGSDSGFVVSHAALASGICDIALIPEMEFTVEEIFADLSTRLTSRKQRQGVPYGIVVMAETAFPKDVDKYLDRNKYQYIMLTDDEAEEIKRFLARGRRVSGQTPDNLRSAALKIVAKELQHLVKDQDPHDPYWLQFQVFTNEPRHLIRSMAPTAMEVIFAKRLGTLAVDSAMAGYTDVIVSQWLTEFVLVPFELATLGKKRVPLNGMFWKAVEASTRQRIGFQA